MLRLALIAILAFCTTAARAQSEEETVALIVSGLDAGVATGNPCGEVGAPERISTSPARFRFDCKSGGSFEVVFRKVDVCRYETFTAEVGKTPDPPATLDFRKFRALLPENPALKLSHFFRAEAGFCTTPGKSECLALLLSVDNGQCCSFPANIPYKRREAAIASLLAGFCPGNNR